MPAANQLQLTPAKGARNFRCFQDTSRLSIGTNCIIVRGSSLLGKTISHYKVLEKIGQGGMGEVYRAEDTNLSREVAIKVLPEQFTQDLQRLARFEREAKLLASLNHPNIAAIYGLEEADGVRFLALELVPGDTLQERVAKGPLPVEEALEVCRQIAEGVEAAHEKGVIHRDLKPANVKVTPEGKVKILDFGLAKAFEAEPPVTDMSQSPTLTEEMTRAGVILGTAAYMSPEQAKGKPVDKRADIFAFGAVLYELLTGKRAFEGETITETIAAVLKSEPDWEALPESIPVMIQVLLRQALRKEPANRLREIGDFLVLSEAPLIEPVPSGLSEKSRQVHWSLVVGLAMLMFLSGAVFWSWLEPAVPTGESPTSRFVIDLGPDQGIPLELPDGISGIYGETLAISHDGQHVVYVPDDPDVAGTQLYLRSIDQLDVRPIPGTENATDPFFSPNDQWIGFLAGNELKKVALSGGPPVPLSAWVASGQNVGAALSWGEHDVIVFGRVASGLWQVPASGGEAQPLTVVDPQKGETSHMDPYFLPGGDALLGTAFTSGG